MRTRLSVRLLASYVLVVAVGAVVAYVTVRLLAPRLFDHRIGMGGGAGHGAGPGGPAHAEGGLGRGAGPGGGGTVHAAFRSAVNAALLLGAAASLVVASGVAAFVTRRLLRPLDAVRKATRRIAAGQYDVSVAPPNEPELAALATDVTTLGRALADTEARRARLLGEVAHEMRTPLTALDGYVEGLIDGVFPSDPETLSAVGDELRRLHRLADDLSTLSRAEEQRLELRPVALDLAELSRRSAQRLAPQFEDADIALSVDAAVPVPVRADPDRIAQVLTNLLGNALVATPPGGQVALRCRRAEGRALVEVRDTGVGLASCDLERVFERFYRAPGPLRRSAGSGVGLTIARGIARASGGDVTAASDGPGRGATFVLELPAEMSVSDHRR